MVELGWVWELSVERKLVINDWDLVIRGGGFLHEHLFLAVLGLAGGELSFTSLLTFTLIIGIERDSGVISMGQGKSWWAEAVRAGSYSIGEGSVGGGSCRVSGQHCGLHFSSLFLFAALTIFIVDFLFVFLIFRFDV